MTIIISICKQVKTCPKSPHLCLSCAQFPLQAGDALALRGELRRLARALRGILQGHLGNMNKKPLRALGGV